MLLRLTDPGISWLQPVIHYSLHLVFPLLIARWYGRETWLRNYGILLLTMLIDLDHLLADPLFAPCRCSIGFHPLHGPLAAAVFACGLLFRKTRLIAIGLLFHLFTDLLDCRMSELWCR